MEVEGIKFHRKIMITSMLILFFVIMGSVSANNSTDLNVNSTFTSDVSDINLVDANNSVSSCVGTNYVVDSRNIGDDEDPETPDVPDIPDIPDIPDDNQTADEGYVNLSMDNIDNYFINGTLGDEYSNTTFNLTHDISSFDVLKVNANNVTIVGNGFSINSPLLISGKDVTLSNFTMEQTVSFNETDGAAILTIASNTIISNCVINYVVPNNVEAYGISAVGRRIAPIYGLQIINCTINFEGHNNKANTYNYGLKLLNAPNALVANNTIVTALPLRDVDFAGGTSAATLDSDYVASVGIAYCDNLTFVGNNISSTVNKRPGSSYPTLDGIIICDSNNVIIKDNILSMEDFLTFPGLNNYLYGFDLWRINNVLIANNNISMRTTGGMLSAGAAYPIQITGPSKKVNITNNDLYSISNGPNIGIYSQNYYGNTELSITNNRINVTGLAGNHSWALVAGIEAQDSNDMIVNNTIEVHSVAEVKDNDNIYGISYSQSTSGNHTFVIKNNTVFSEAQYAVSLLSAVNSVITDNLLVSTRQDSKESYDAFNTKGDLKNTTYYNNKVVNYFDYFANIYNHIDGGEVFNYTTPTNTGNISNKIDGSNINPLNPSFPNRNPLIPKDGDNPNVIVTPDDSSYSTVTPDVPDGDDSYVDVPDLPDDDGGSQTNHNQPDSNTNSNATGSSLLDALLNYLNSESNNQDSNSGSGSSDNGNNNQNSPVNSDSRSNSSSKSNVNSLSGTNSGNANSGSYNTKIQSNSSSSESPSVNGNPSSASGYEATPGESANTVGSSAGSSGEASAGRVFEINKDILNNDGDTIIASVVVILIFAILIFVGYKRRKSNEQ